MVEGEGSAGPVAGCDVPAHGAEDPGHGAGIGPIAGSAPEVLDALSTAISAWDSSLHCVWANAAGAALQGRTRQAMIGASAEEVLGAERLQALMPYIEQAMRGEPVELETQRVREGRLRHSRIKGLPRRLPDGRIDGFVVLTTDITEERALRETAQALTASEAKFRALADSLPVGVFHADAQSRNTYTNKRWQEIAGLTLEESLGDGWRSVVHPDDRDAVFREWEETAGGADFAMSIRLQRADGSVRHVVGRARPLLAPDGSVVGTVGTTEDVTERLAAERELGESQALLDRVGRLASVGGWELLLPQWQIRCTDQTCAIFERPPGYRPPAREMLAHFPDEAAARLDAALQRAAHVGDPFDLVLPMRTAQGRLIHLRAVGEAERGEGGDVVRVVGALQDVTQRHEAELAIARSNEAQRLLYERTPAMLHSIDTAGRLVSVSDRWLSSLGYERHEVLGRLSVDFLTPGSREAVLGEYLPRLWRGGREDRLSLQMQRRDGSVIDVLLSAVVQHDPDGRPVRALAVIEDVTALLDRAAQLQREQTARRSLERQAAELARLAAERREMLDLLAHEVRQPLNNASAAIESAGAMLADKGERGASARLVRAQGVLTEVQRHVDNTLAVSALLSNPPAPPEEEADIDTVVSVALAELPREDRARVTVRRHTAARTALMDSALVRLALRNLLGNAIRHTPPATPVTVVISDSDAPLALFIDIIDEGGGLPAELLPRLFERGNRVRHRDGRESHGLGLFIAHRALQAQGGDLQLLHSGPQGTALRLVLPQGQAG